jgi:hypothetical protein
MVADAYLQSEYFKDLKHLCNNCICMLNDIISYVKEARGTGNNIIHVFLEKDGCSFIEAVQKTKNKYLEDLKKIQKMLENAPTFPSYQKKYVKGLLLWIRSSYDWSLETQRYRYKKIKEEIPHPWKKA